MWLPGYDPVPKPKASPFPLVQLQLVWLLDVYNHISINQLLSLPPVTFMLEFVGLPQSHVVPTKFGAI